MEREWSGDGGGCGFFSLFFFFHSLSLSLSPFVSQSVKNVFLLLVLNNPLLLLNPLLLNKNRVKKIERGIQKKKTHTFGSRH